MDTIPIEELVQKTKALAIEYGSKLVLAEIAALTGPISGFFAPIINFLLKEAVNWVVTLLINKGDKFLFGLNMPLVTSDQGKDYRDAVAKVLSLPDDVSDADWEAAEDEANHKFQQLNNFAA